MEDSPLNRIQAALIYHETTCPLETRAILLNPANFELLGVTEVQGVPLIADERVAAGRFQIDCDGSTANFEEEVARALREQTVIPAS